MYGDNSCRSRCVILQICLGELKFLAAIAEYEIREVYLDSKYNRISDHLSKWDHSDHHKELFFNVIEHGFPACIRYHKERFMTRKCKPIGLTGEKCLNLNLKVHDMIRGQVHVLCSKRF